MRRKSDNDHSIMEYVEAIFRHQGRDFTHCELCHKSITKYELHHEKYENATIKDIKIVCHGCNQRTTNKNLV